MKNGDNEITDDLKAIMTMTFKSFNNLKYWVRIRIVVLSIVLIGLTGMLIFFYFHQKITVEFNKVAEQDIYQITKSLSDVDNVFFDFIKEKLVNKYKGEIQVKNLELQLPYNLSGHNQLTLIYTAQAENNLLNFNIIARHRKSDRKLLATARVISVIDTQGIWTVDNLFKNLKKGYAVVSACERMDFGDTEMVYLIASYKQRIEELKKMVPKEHQTVDREILISDVMRGNLQGMEFEIKPMALKEQAIKSVKPTMWSWMIKPKRPGEHDLAFTLQVLAKVKGIPASINLEVFNEKIIVDVSKTQKAILFLQKHSGYLYPIIAAVFTIVVSIISFFMGKRSN